MIKHSLGEEVGLNEKFLGFIDGVGFIWDMCWTHLYNTIPPKKTSKRLPFILHCDYSGLSFGSTKLKNKRIC